MEDYDYTVKCDDPTGPRVHSRMLKLRSEHHPRTRLFLRSPRR